MTFKLGVINALPRLGLRAGRLARSLGTFFLGGYVDEVRCLWIVIPNAG